MRSVGFSKFENTKEHAVQKAEKGNTVKVHYTGTLNDGSVFDSSKERDPLEFQIGSGALIPGFENGVIGMAIEEVKEVNIPAAEAYGERNEELLFGVPISEVPEGLNPQVGQSLQIQNAEGQLHVVVVQEITDSEIKLDANHPLAGKDLKFEIELLEIA